MRILLAGVGVRARGDQGTNDADDGVTFVVVRRVGDGAAQRRFDAGAGWPVGIGAALEEELDRGELASLGGDAEGREHALVAADEG